MSEVHGAHAIETKDGRLVALLILPMPWDTFVNTMEGLGTNDKDLMVRQATNYRIVRQAERRRAAPLAGTPEGDAAMQTEIEQHKVIGSLIGFPPGHPLRKK